MAMNRPFQETEMSAEEKRARARELYVPGVVTLESVAKILGVSKSTVLRYVNDEYNERTLRLSREAKQRRTGTCSECGGETRYNGHTNRETVNGASTMCDTCAHTFTHCAKGHLYTPETDLRQLPGYRRGHGHSCRICRNAYMREWFSKRRRAEGRPERDPALYESRRLNLEAQGDVSHGG